MAKDHHIEEKHMSEEQLSDSPVEKQYAVHQETAHGAAERGHAATDACVPILVSAGQRLTVHSYGNPIVYFDKDAEKRLRRKIDMMIIPTVALLYLFCFIDRANIGMSCLANSSLPSS